MNVRTSCNEWRLIMEEKSWFAVHTKPRCESQADAYLRSQKLDTYYPTLTVKPVNPRASKIRPFFPGYLFIHVNLEAVGRSALEWAPGTTGLVSFGGEPAAIPDHFI